MGRSTKYTGTVAVIVSTMLDLPVDSEEWNTLLRALEVLDPHEAAETDAGCRRTRDLSRAAPKRCER